MKKKFALYLLITLYLLAGINHFWNPSTYLPLIPHYLPWPATINYLAGTAEILLALGMALKATRKWAAYGIVAMLLAFVPTHIFMIEQAPFALGKIMITPLLAWIRLLVFQPLLMGWAWWVKDVEGV